MATFTTLRVFSELASYFLIKAVWWKQCKKTTWIIWYDIDSYWWNPAIIHKS